MRLEQNGRKRRGQRERIDGRQHGRDGDRQGELAIELALQAREERRGDEHGRQHRGNGQNRPGHLIHGFARGFLWRLAQRHMAFHVFDHHDGVVHHDAYR
ncbi:hypothetical protein G6F65_023047 [Rhizopus arrhizus]|nr:hypothetical protein G6F24_018382 [Rhizopus arrhizus]KAG1242387.1 hypothetical protein G6F65_023047 [Rhizopus arrhizus]